jgi:hypothetical protein
MSSSYEQLLTGRGDTAIPAFSVVALVGTVTDGALDVTMAATGDVAAVIGVTTDECAAGGLVSIIPLGRGGATKIRAKFSENIAIGDAITLSATDGVVSDDGEYQIGVALSAGVSASDANVIIEVLTGYAPVDLGT